MSTLVQIRSYQNGIEANKDKQILAANGITSWIANEQTIQSDWLLSNALGGIQLQVFEDEKEKALAILKEFEEEDAATELEVDFWVDDPEYNFNCPKCGSNHIYRDEKPGGLFGISLLLFMIPLRIKSQIFHCYYCGNEFKN